MFAFAAEVREEKREDVTDGVIDSLNGYGPIYIAGLKREKRAHICIE